VQHEIVLTACLKNAIIYKKGKSRKKGRFLNPTAGNIGPKELLFGVLLQNNPPGASLGLIHFKSVTEKIPNEIIHKQPVSA